MHLNKLSQEIKESVNKNTKKAADFIGTVHHEIAIQEGIAINTIGVSDGISMGTKGMRYSLPSREVIADSMETVVGDKMYEL